MRKPIPPQPEEPAHVILSVALSDDSFKTTLRVAVDAAAADKDKAVKRWLETIQFGLKIEGDVLINYAEGKQP